MMLGILWTGIWKGCSGTACLSHDVWGLSWEYSEAAGGDLTAGGCNIMSGFWAGGPPHLGLLPALHVTCLPHTTGLGRLYVVGWLGLNLECCIIQGRWFNTFSGPTSDSVNYKQVT